jgi:hypothetical protein
MLRRSKCDAPRIAAFTVDAARQKAHIAGYSRNFV